MANLFDKIGELGEKGAETMERVTSGDVSVLGGVFQGSRIQFWIDFIKWFAIVLFAGVFFYKFVLQYKHKVLVKKLKGNAVVDHYFTRAKEITDERGKRKLALFKNRKTCPVPVYSITSKMGKKDFFTLYEDDDGELHPWDETKLHTVVGEVVEETKKLINPQVMKSWRLDEIKLMEEKYKQKSFIMEHLPEFILFITAMSCLGMIWITAKMIQSTYIKNAAAFMEVARSCLGVG